MLYTMTADAGSFVVSGKPAALAVQRVLVCETADSVYHHLTLEGDESGYLLLEGDAVDDITDALKIEGDEHVGFDVTGVSVTLNVGMPCVHGEFVLVGMAATLRATRYVSLGKASYTLNGISTSLIASRLIGSGYGAFSLTGNSAALYKGITFAPVFPGQFVFRGVAAKLSWSGATAPSFETFLVKPPNSKVVNPNTGTLNHEWDVFLKNLTDRLNALNPNYLER